MINKEALREAIMRTVEQHFDGGGTVLPQSTTSGGIGGLLTNQNGYQAQLAPTQTSNYAPTIDQASQQALAGYGSAQGIQAQQQGLANQLQAETQGGGPNPAQAALAQNTGTNVANQAALMAGQRGAGANAGLIARQAAQQGASTQQQAVGQAANLQAQQQLAAQQELQQQQATMGGQNIQEQGVNASLFGTAAGAQNAQNNTAVQNYGMAQGINANVAQNNANNANAMTGKILGGIPSALSDAATLFGFSEGGEADNPKLARVPSKDRFSGAAERRSHYPAHLEEVAHYYHGDSVDFRGGGPVPGEPIVQKDSIKNDVVPAKLSPKEIVLPLSVTQAKDAPAAAARFVAETLAKSGSKLGQEQEFKDALKKAISGRKKAEK